MNWNPPKSFHATNPFSNVIADATRWETLTDNPQEPTIADMFSELMSDYISNTEQNMEMTTAAEQLGSSQASPDSTDPVNSTGSTTRNNAWPPLEVTDYSLEEWPNSNKKPPYETSAAEETASRNSNHSTPVAAPRTPSINKNPLDSHVLDITANRNDQNPFLSGYAQKVGPSTAPTKPNDNQALSWHKTYSMDQAMIGRWIARLDQYHFKTIHRPRMQHRNVDGLSKRTNDYINREQILEKLPEVSEGFNFMSQKDYDELPTVPYFDKRGHLIPDHPKLSPEARAQLPLLYILQKKRKSKQPEEPTRDTPWYPEIQWETTPTLEENERPNRILSITTSVPPARIDTTKPDPTLEALPIECQKQADVLRTIEAELHEHHLTKYGLRDLHMAQNRDVHLLALKKLMKNEPLEDPMFPDEIQDFAKRYYHQKKDLLSLNPDDILCLNYVPQQRALRVRPCMIIMPQFFQHEILYRAHDESEHQGVEKVLARIQERHTWPGIKRDVVNHIKQCLTCQQAKHPAGNPCYPLQGINSSNFNDLVQFDHLKLCKTDSGNTGLLVIIDHFTEFAEAVPCAHDEYDAQTTAKIILNKWFARHGTPARMQPDNATNFTAEVAQELMKASQVTKVTSTPAHPRGNGLVERQNRTLLTLLRVYTSCRMQDWDEYIDGVLGAYNSTRHATTGFSPYMLHHGAEKSIPPSFIYPEFNARDFVSKEEFVEHLLARQREIHELVRRNTHQAQLRQKLKFDRHLKAKAHAVGDAVWVFCHIIPKGGTRKLIRAWRGPHKVTDVLQDGRLYVIDSGPLRETKETRTSPVGLDYLPEYIKI